MAAPIQFDEVRKNQRRIAALLNQDSPRFIRPTKKQRRHPFHDRGIVYVCSRYDPDGRYRDPALDFMQQGLNTVRSQGVADRNGPPSPDKVPYAWNFKTRSEIELRKHFSTPIDGATITDRVLNEVREEYRPDVIRSYGDVINRSDIERYDYGNLKGQESGSFDLRYGTNLPAITEHNREANGFSSKSQTLRCSGRGDGHPGSTHRTRDRQHQPRPRWSKDQGRVEWDATDIHRNADQSHYNQDASGSSLGATRRTDIDRHDANYGYGKQPEAMVLISSYGSQQKPCRCKHPVLSSSTEQDSGCFECGADNWQHKPWCNRSSDSAHCKECKLVGIHETWCTQPQHTSYNSLEHSDNVEERCGRCSGLVKQPTEIANNRRGTTVRSMTKLPDIKKARTTKKKKVPTATLR